MKRDLVLSDLTVLVTAAAVGQGLAAEAVRADCLLLDEDDLPAISVLRGSDAPLGTADGEPIPSVRRELVIAVDIYAAAGAQALVDAVELAVRQGVWAMVGAGKLNGAGVSVRWAVEELGVPYLAGRLQVVIDYSEDGPW